MPDRILLACSNSKSVALFAHSAGINPPTPCQKFCFVIANTVVRPRANQSRSARRANRPPNAGGASRLRLLTGLPNLDAKIASFLAAAKPVSDKILYNKV